MVALSRGPTTWARTSAGMAAWVRVPHCGQVRVWPWCSVTTAATSGSSATWCQVGGGSCGPGFGTTAADGNYRSDLDSNGDGAINGLDLVAFRSRFGVV